MPAPEPCFNCARTAAGTSTPQPHLPMSAPPQHPRLLTCLHTCPHPTALLRARGHGARAVRRAQHAARGGGGGARARAALGLWRLAHQGARAHGVSRPGARAAAACGARAGAVAVFVSRQPHGTKQGLPTQATPPTRPPASLPSCRSDVSGLAASLLRQALPCHIRITTAASSRSSSAASLANRI